MDWDVRWGEAQRQAWKEIKNVLSAPEFLVPPRRGFPKRMLTDSSGYGIGGVLLQRVSGGSWRPVSLSSRNLTTAEEKYTVTERECLAIVHCLRKWRCYLHGEQNLVVETDHFSLKWLMSLKEPRGRLARWMVEVQDFDFVVKYSPGASMVVPDALSRDAVTKPLCQRCFGEIAPADGDAEVAKEIEEERGIACILSGGFRTRSLMEAQEKEFA